MNSIKMSSNGLYPDTRNQLKFTPEIVPDDYVVGPDPYVNWDLFAPPSLSSFSAQPSQMKFGQRYISDNPFGQRIPGVLYGPSPIA